MEKNYGIFIGLTCVPAYSTLSFDHKTFVDSNLLPIFEGYKKCLSDFIDGSGLNKHLYEPVIFTSLGNFDIISLTLIDDFYFGNFHFKPYSKHILHKFNSTNFQYQIIYSLENIYLNLNELHELRNYNFISIVRLKINYLIYKDSKANYIDEIKENLKIKLSQYINNPIIISTSYSWHELTLIVVGNNLIEVKRIITLIRTMSIPNQPQNSEINHLFVDTHTTFGIAQSLFDTNWTDDLFKMQNYGCENIKLTSKIQLKTGHGNEVKRIFKQTLPNINIKLHFIDGRSDYSITFESLFDYLNFWNNNDLINAGIYNHIRKVHTNLQFEDLEFSSSTPNPKTITPLKLNATSKFVLENQFDVEITINKIESILKKLHVSRELTNNIISAFISYNDLITDISLINYALDLKFILCNLENIIYKLAQDNDSLYRFKFEHNYHSVKDVSKVLYKYVEVFQIAYQNRFQESKRYGYNSDNKVEFNGGVHRLIQSFDLMYKLIVYTLEIPELNDKSYLPIAIYGSQTIGISSTIDALHINYYQLFQPEIFLIALPKEAFNQQILRYFYDRNSYFLGNIIQPLGKLSEELAIQIHEENNLDIKQSLFEFCTPDNLDSRINYIITYYAWVSLIFNRDELDLFTKWFWFIFLQTTENYNIDGSLRVEILRRTLFDFILTLKFINKNYDPFITLNSTFKSTPFHFLLFNNENFKKVSMNVEVFQVIDFLKKNKFFEEIRTIISKVLELSINLIENTSTKSFFEDYKDFTIRVMIDFAKEIFPNLPKTVILKRDYNLGSALNTASYSNLVADPHGGFFPINAEARERIFAYRVSIQKKIYNLTLKYKNQI